MGGKEEEDGGGFADGMFLLLSILYRTRSN